MAKVLIIGSGGREHALAYKMKQSSQVERVYVAPGNVGMKDIATCVDIAINDHQALIDFAIEHAIKLTIVGPEEPLVNGIVDDFEAAGLLIFGPRQQAAQLEGSKRFAKDLMRKYNIPTASYETFYDAPSAINYLQQQSYPIVIKASGLAAGKGVVIANDVMEAKQAIQEMMVDHKFKEAANEVVIESFLEGEEFSFLSLVEGEVIIPLEIAQDHKRAFDYDLGPNTGGMGAYAPVSTITAADRMWSIDNIIKPTVRAMESEGHAFSGVLYAGLIKTKTGIQVIEYNVRFGDPETEILMLALKSDLYEVIDKLKHGKSTELKWTTNFTIGAVLANKGYPESYQNGDEIFGLEDVESNVFHMGTAEKNGKIVTSGGRVLFVSAQGETLKEARNHLYREIKKIYAPSLFYRKDIGFHNLKEDL